MKQDTRSYLMDLRLDRSNDCLLLYVNVLLKHTTGSMEW